MGRTLVTYDPLTEREDLLELDPEPSDLPPGTFQPSDRKDFTQAELSDLLKTSDRTIRSYLSKLKEIYFWREPDLTLPSGRYSPFAYTELVKLQQAIAPFVPSSEGMVKNADRINFRKYRELVWEREQVQPVEESGAIVLSANDEDQYSVEVLETSLDTIQDAGATVVDSYWATVGNFRQLGRQLGSQALAAMSEEFHGTIQQGMSDLAQAGKVQPSRKKS
jgi:hypothetical protein